MQDVSEKIVEVGVTALKRGLVAYTFVLECLASFWQIKYKLNVYHAPFWLGFNLCGMQSRIELTPNTTITLIEQSHNTPCIATYYH